MCLGIPGRILAIHDRDGMPMGQVEFGGIAKEICLAYVPEAEIGEYVLVHVGFAISRIDEQEATEIFSYIQQIGELEDVALDGAPEGALQEAPGGSPTGRGSPPEPEAGG